MANVFIYKTGEFNQYDISSNEDIFGSILEKRENDLDSKRFFLKYIPASLLSKYNFNDENSLNEFRNVHLSIFTDSIKGMGGCNLREEMLEKDIRYAGIKLSDPYKKIPGVFDIRNSVMTYSPIFPFFYEERDLIKFANDTYFTSIPFETILINQINNATKYYIHIGNYQMARETIKYGRYILEQISKEQMIEYATNPELGEKVRKKYLKI